MGGFRAVRSHLLNIKLLVMDDDEVLTPAKKSAVAEDIAELNKSVQRLSRERERLPQPLFWSLFHTRLAAIKKHKEVERTLASILGESEV